MLPPTINTGGATMQMTRISVPVTIAERELLQLSAQRESQHPRDYARYLLRQALGLTDEQSAPRTDHPQPNHEMVLAQ